MDVDIARDMQAAGHIAGIMFIRRLQVRATAGTLRYSHTVLVPPMVKRARSAAMPMGLAKGRKWVLSTPPSLRTMMTLPA